MRDVEALVRELIEMNGDIRMAFGEWRWVLSADAVELLREQFDPIAAQAGINLIDEEVQIFGLPVRLDEHARLLHPMLELRR